MKIMNGSHRFSRPTILTLGNFDGVHIGHQRILNRLVERAKYLNLPSVVYTFDPHPLNVVAPNRRPPLITTTDEKAYLLSKFGVDCLVLAEFTKEFSSQHPEEFVKDVLVGSLKAAEVLVGHDYTFGRGKTGTVEYLKEAGRKFGFKAEVIPAYKKWDKVVSSSQARSLLRDGNVKKVASLLGRYYSISGKVVDGDKRGKELGFPTANIETISDHILKNGVYIVNVILKERKYHGVVNIGLVPTFGGGMKRLEVYILDFAKQIYDKNIRLEFIQRLRGERLFDTPEVLISQIHKDVGKTRKFFSK